MVMNNQELIKDKLNDLKTAGKVIIIGKVAIMKFLFFYFLFI